jgi:hypothetical protein
MAVLAMMAAAVPTAAQQSPRVPRDAADWASFTVTEQRAAIDYQWRLLQDALADGTAVVRTVSATAVTPAAGSLSDISSAVTARGYCHIQFIDQLHGSWVRGGGWTSASSPIYYIYASRSGRRGQFFKDGVSKGTWWEEKAGGAGHTHAESWTPYDFKWWFERFNYTVQGWHGAQRTLGGTWLLGPDAYCTLTVFR